MMNQRLKDVLEGTYENYVLPFFWLHGAEESVLRNCMAKIYACGIRAVCLEARPHPDFLGEKWWKDLDIILDEARKRGMKIWILDDSHFPTGYANGAVKNAPDKLKRWSLTERMIAVEGPLKYCKFDISSQLGVFYQDKGQSIQGQSYQEELVAVIVGKRTEQNGQEIYTELEDVTSAVSEDGWFYKDFPEGNYCIFIYTKRLGAAFGQNDYISMLEKDSVKILLDTVYEPHYQRYGSEFGKTIAGFFSDEPGFYNDTENLYGLGQIGKKMPLPWTDDVMLKFRHDTKENYTEDLTALTGLFHSIGGKERMARYTYMDVITRKYQENFSEQIGDWCENHGVEYIGHVLENGLFTQSLGAGTGHYFRALQGQHMGGIDIVLNDLLSGKDYDDYAFYHYQLPILASSIAQQNEKMKGRAMCEVFGAFGWSEGLNMMKWMADYMLVHGINYFVPHAFTDKAFPDMDCPPHFYAQGNNPQYRHMHVLFQYMNRVSHLLNGGRMNTEVAVLFPAESAWCGESRDFGFIGKLCLQNQIPYAVLCMDAIKKASVADGKIVIGKAVYPCLLVDKAEYMPKEYLDELKKLAEKGVNICFIEKVPKIAEIDNEGACGIEKTDDFHTSAAILKEEEVISFLSQYRLCKTQKFEKWLRCCRYEQENMTIFMFLNSSMSEVIETEIELGASVICGYDALNERLFIPQKTKEDKIKLFLEKGESVLFFTGKERDMQELSDFLKEKNRLKNGNSFFKVSCQNENVQSSSTKKEFYNGKYEIFAASYTDMENFQYLLTTEHLDRMDQWKKDFSGIIKYKLKIHGKRDKMNLGDCYGSAEVWVNGNNCGTRISYPYEFEIAPFMENAENEIEIQLATTLFEAMKDPLSRERAVEPSGILGPLWFEGEV